GVGGGPGRAMERVKSVRHARRSASMALSTRSALAEGAGVDRERRSIVRTSGKTRFRFHGGAADERSEQVYPTRNGDTFTARRGKRLEAGTFHGRWIKARGSRC